MNDEIDQLKREKKVLETDVRNLEKREMITFDNIDSLDAECLELELKKKQLDASIRTLQVNFNDRLKTLTEDLGLYVIEAIRKYAGQKLGNVTIDDLIDDTAHFGGILREMLEEPSGEFFRIFNQCTMN